MGKLYNLAGMSTATTGTGTITLGSALSGLLSFANAGVANGETITYAIRDGSNAEIGRGVYTSSGTTLTRSVLRSTNSNSPISLSGSAEVRIVAAAEDVAVTPDSGQGRLTLVANTAIMSGITTGATHARYTPYTGLLVRAFDGGSFSTVSIGSDLSQAFSDTTKSPGAAVANTNYYLFVWDDAGTARCTRGPAWSSDTTPGTGAGSTELEWLDGVPVNKYAITNGPAARRGTCVGVIRTDASGLGSWAPGGSGVGGVAANLSVWNMFNRVDQLAVVQNSSASWTYNSATPRQVAASSNMRVSFVSGLEQEAAAASWYCLVTGATSNDTGVLGVGIDSTNTISGQPGYTPRGVAGANIANAASRFLGSHYMQALEASNGTGTVTFYGSGTGAIFANAFSFRFRM